MDLLSFPLSISNPPRFILCLVSLPVHSLVHVISQIVIKLFENTLNDVDSEDRFSVEIRFSAGAVCDAQLAEFPEFNHDHNESTMDEVS